MQYVTGVTGNIMSYNYPNTMLQNQNYNTCIRQEEGETKINKT